MSPSLPLSFIKTLDTSPQKDDTPNMKNSDATTFDDLIHEKRIPTLTALADLTGVHISRLSQLKNGRAKPYRRSRDGNGKSETTKLAEFFEITEDELLAMF